MKSERTPKPSSLSLAAAVRPAGDGAARPAPAGPRPRLFGADALKAVAIVGVVFIHADGVFAVPKAFHDTVADMFRFGVPAFIALYVHFAARSTARPERFGRLLLQFVFWSALYAVVTAQWATLTPVKFFTRHWSGNGWAGQFYFIVILQLTLLLPWIRRTGAALASRRLLLFAGSLAFYVVLVYPDWHVPATVAQVSDRPFVYWLPYAWLGIAWSGLPACASARRWLAAGSVALIPIEFRLVEPHNMVNSVYMLPSVFVATACLLWLARPSVVIRTDASPTVPPWLERAVSLLSANTLGIFVLNPMIVLLLQRLLSNLPIPAHAAAAVALPLLAAAMVLAIALALTLVLKRTEFGRRLLV